MTNSENSDRKDCEAEDAGHRFVLSEYNQLWRQISTIFSTRDRAIGLYFLLLGGLGSAALRFAFERAPLHEPQGFLSAGLRPLFNFHAFMTIFMAGFIVAVSTILMLLFIRWRVLNLEYVNCLNRIRRGFIGARPELQTFLLLPTDRYPTSRSSSSDGALYFFILFFSAASLWFGVFQFLFFVLNETIPVSEWVVLRLTIRIEEIAAVIAMAITSVWVVGWTLYRWKRISKMRKMIDARLASLDHGEAERETAKARKASKATT